LRFKLRRVVAGPARTGRRHDVRVMLMIKGDPQPGAAPSEELLGAIGRYNDELKEAGVLIDLAGLLPSAMGRRVRLSGGNRAVSPRMTLPPPTPGTAPAGSGRVRGGANGLEWPG
jgi:hypothetical protein